MSLNLDSRIFIPIENSAGGVVDTRTEFYFSQKGEAFEASYHGGDILKGHILGHFTGHWTADLLYHCETLDSALKAGRASANFNQNSEGKLTMSLDWEWVSGADGAGKSHYIELSESNQRPT